MSRPKPLRFRFEVALSFAGDGKRPQVRAVAELLRRELGDGKVFFDEWFEAELAGPDAQIVLQNFYRKEARLIVACICDRYGGKPWTQEEWRSIQALERELRDAAGENRKRMRFLPLRFGEGDIDGVFDTAIVPDMRTRTTEQTAALILERLRLTKGSTRSRTPTKKTAARARSGDPPGEAALQPDFPSNERRLGVLWQVPPLPLEYQPRTQHEAIKAQLLSSERSDVVLLGHYARHAIEGMAGVGKSVLAAAVARDEEVRRAFPDGVFWVALGQNPGDVRALQSRLCRALGGDHASFETEEAGRGALGELLADRKCLLVLDDVWDENPARAFDALGGLSRLLVTTRKSKVANELRTAQETFSIGDLSREQAATLLARCAGIGPGQALPAEAAALAEECGDLPLALALVGAALKGRPLNRWKTQLQRLKSAGLAGLEKARAALELSIDELSERSIERYLDLAVFPEDTLIPEATLHTYWAQEGLEEGEVQDIVDDLVGRSLVRRDEECRIFLHDLQHDYLRARVTDLPALDRRLVTGYRRGAPDGLHNGPNDGYFFRAIVDHLLRAEGQAAVRELLLDVRWLGAKLAVTETNALLRDFDLLRGDSSAELLHGALRISAHILDRDPNALGAQLLARLSPQSAPELQPLLEAARASIQAPALIPLRPTFTAPGGPLLRTFEGHSGWVTSVTLSADGRRALSGSWDTTLKLWDTESGALLRTFEGHAASVTSVALSADGRRALSGSWDTTLKLWDTESGALLHTFEGHAAPVTSVGLTADRRRALSGSEDETLKLWDIESGALLCTFEGHAASVTSVALSADGRRALSGSSDNTLKLWDTESGMLLRTFEGHAASVTSVALSADGRRALSGSWDTTLKLWDTESGALLRTFEGHASSVTSVALSADGPRAVSGASYDATVNLWDIESGALLCTFEEHASSVTSVAFSTDGRRALSGSSDSTLKLWDTESGMLLRRFEGHAYSVTSVALGADGRRALSGSEDETLKLWDTESGALLRTSQGHAVRRLLLNATHELYYFSETPATLSADGRWALSGSSGNTLKLWDTESGTLLRTFEGHSSYVTSVTLSADGRRALSGSYDTTLMLWDAESGALLYTFNGHASAVTSVALSADGRRALSGSGDNTLKLWDTGSGALLRTFEGHAASVTSVTLSADGRRALSGSSDNTLKLWELSGSAAARSSTTGAPSASFTGDGAITAVALDAARGRAFAGDGLGRIHAFEVRG